MRLREKIRKEYESEMKIDHDFDSLKNEIPIREKPKSKKTLIIATASLAGVLIIGGITGVTIALSTSSSLSNILLNERPYLLNKTVTKFDLNDDSLDSIASKSLDFLSDYLFIDDENVVVSPASLALAEGALILVSSNIDEFAQKTGFDVSNIQEELSALLNGMNWQMIQGTDQIKRQSEKNSYIKSLVLIQQIGEMYQFDKDKIAQFEDTYVQFAKSSIESSKTDAEKIFNNRIGLTLEATQATDVGVIISGALTMRDSLEYPFYSSENSFYLSDGTSIKVDSAELSKFNSIPFYKGENYTAIIKEIRYTQMMFILPDEGVPLSDINIDEAYYQVKENASYVNVEGYLPYFKVDSEMSLYDKFKNNLTHGNLCDKILSPNPDKLIPSLVVSDVIQNSKFEFDSKGVKGESITAILYYITDN